MTNDQIKMILLTANEMVAVDDSHKIINHVMYNLTAVDGTMATDLLNTYHQIATDCKMVRLYPTIVLELHTVNSEGDQYGGNGCEANYYVYIQDDRWQLVCFTYSVGPEVGVMVGADIIILN